MNELNNPNALRDLMVDTETTGTGPNAAVVSIGAVFFSEHTGQIGATFKRNIHLATAVAKGFVIEPAAVLWWMQQPDAARNAAFLQGEQIEKVMQEFHDWIVANGPGIDDLRVFGCSPAFDCVKLDTHFKACGIETPWHYWAERCYRTIRDRNRNVEEDERTGLHNALDDAIFQAKHLIKIRHAKKGPANGHP